ncbi:LrgB family protein [Zavarzinia compransoris]|uniref:Murein hydrolase effector protein LrgB n=1 Tax=Zavarzinia compransoris TaxID=1264899 RepID=A0A317E7I6_9PROT|nr:LrgB family protein [Zavarzinia compransoris]PWR22240.1 murein hydrolase effector protein LrgB [Zavarzinia compransoris]TDP47002.1 putative murein hydrolase (TIGR00659 family) [Zavarzinia compransoris]
MAADLTLLFWPAATIVAYLGCRALYRRWPGWHSSPLLTTPIVLILLAVGLQASYGDYLLGTHWLMAMVGPLTVAFALPIYDQRAVIRRHWLPLAVGVAVGSLIAIATGSVLARLLDLSPELRQSLLPRSVTMPFAMNVSGHVGGLPELTAVFVMITGIVGAALGDLLLKVLPLRSAMARGALFGMGAHGAGVAKAREVGAEEGSVAGLVMILAGLANVAVAPVLIMAFA